MNSSPFMGEDSDACSHSELAELGEGATTPRKRNLLPLAKRMRRTPTDAEGRLLSMLRAGRMNGAKFKRQVPIGSYIADFVCFQARLIIEADGSQHAESGADRDRDAWFASEGFRVLRFWNNDIISNPDGVARAILSALSHSSPLVGEESAACSQSELAKLGEDTHA